jgi:hypothetical protein
VNSPSFMEFLLALKDILNAATRDAQRHTCWRLKEGKTCISFTK